jgi:MOSC domain-containing protein YiiM
MKVISVAAGRPKEVTWRGTAVRSSIWKTPIEGRVRVLTLGLEDDQQSDLTVHGGVDKAVYVYPSEHYGSWQSELPELDFPWGAFGENLTTEGLLEEQMHVGDRLRMGSAEFVVTQPRMPCYKLGVRFDRTDMVKRFLQSKRSGFYLAVLREGEVGAGDSIEFMERQTSGVTITDIVNLYTADFRDEELLRRAVESPALPDGWKDHFRQMLQADGA